MFESEFVNKRMWQEEKKLLKDFNTSLSIEEVEKVQLLYWREHCLECAPPDCYHTCNFYEPRIDRRCSRFKYGIFPNRHFSGLLEYGADIKFKKWAKLGTNLYNASLTPNFYLYLSKFDRLLAKMVNTIYLVSSKINLSQLLDYKPYNPQTIVHKGLAFFRERTLKNLKLNRSYAEYESFILECFSFEKDDYSLQMEYSEETLKSRQSFCIMPGKNYYEIPIEEFKGNSNPLSGSLNIYPENDLNVNIIFTWLNFIKRKEKIPDKIEKKRIVPAEKVKCVAWDLDNTLWDGIFIESEKGDLKLNRNAVVLVKELDKRGIIQTIASKNNYEEVKEQLENFGLWDYFLYPAINWAPKSSNLIQISKLLNINIDTFALIDDQKFERTEVSNALPQVRVYKETEINQLLDYPEFNVPVTETSKIRRQSYLSQIQREKVLETFGDDYTTFLKSCKMKMHIVQPKETKHKNRCHELLQRSNQLNLSTRRYSKEEFEKLLTDQNILCVAFDCSDRFGVYGIVGFASIYLYKEQPKINDLVISCRVAQKMVEQTFFEWLIDLLKKQGSSALKAEIIKTKRNGPLVKVFESLPFEVLEENEKTIKLILHFKNINEKSNVIEVASDIQK